MPTETWQIRSRSLATLRRLVGRTVWSVRCPGLILDVAQPGRVRTVECALDTADGYTVVSAPEWIESPSGGLDAHQIEVRRAKRLSWGPAPLPPARELRRQMDAEASASTRTFLSDSVVELRLFAPAIHPNPAPVRAIEVHSVTKVDEEFDEAITFDRTLVVRSADDSAFSVSVDDDRIAGEVFLATTPEAIAAETAGSTLRLVLD